MTNLFSNISFKHREKILRSLEALTYNFPRDSQILSNVKLDNAICMILSGYAQITRVDYNGNQVIIEELHENSVFGTLISSLDNLEYEIITKEATSIVVIDYYNIIKLIDSNNIYNNQFIKNVLIICTEHIEKQNDRIEILTRRSIREKLLAYFNNISKKQFSKNIILPLSLTDLADYLSIDRSAMMRELRNLKDDGIIKGKGQKIKLLY